MVNIYKYLDYREYLRDLYDHLKATKPQFSFRFFSKQAGFKSPNYLKMVMDGDRNLTASSIMKFCEGLKLKQDEQRFFENLVNYTQSKDIKEKNLYYKRLASSSKYIELHKLDNEIYEYFSNWYNVAVYEMLSMKGFRPDPTWIAHHMRPEITMSEAKKALDTLEALGLVKKEKNKLLKSKGNLATESEVQSIAAVNFQKAMIEKGGESIDRISGASRDISSLTIAIRKDRIGEVKELVQNFRRQLHALLQDDKNADVVYQLNFQFFPLTKQVKSNKEPK